MEFTISVSVAMKKDSRYIIIKRSEGGTYPGLWEFPSGRVEPDERLEETAKREVLEETGLKIKKLSYIGYSERFAKDTQCLIHHFFSYNFSGEVKLSNEHSDFRWATKEEIQKMVPLKDVGNDTLRFFELAKSQ